MPRMTREHEIGRGGQDLEPKPNKPLVQLLAASNNPRAALLEVCLVLNRGNRPRLRRPAKRIGVEAILDPVQRLDQAGVTDRIPPPRSPASARDLDMVRTTSRFG